MEKQNKHDNVGKTKNLNQICIQSYAGNRVSVDHVERFGIYMVEIQHKKLLRERKLCI